MNLDVSEYDRWARTAREHLRAARFNLEGGFHSTAVLLAEQAAQCALKALLHGIGESGMARGHGLVSLAAACAVQAGLDVDEHLQQSLARLAREYQSTRYPDALPEGAPVDYYGQEDAAQGVAVAEAILERVSRAWVGLQRADGE